MNLFIQTSLDTVQSILSADTPALLAALDPPLPAIRQYGNVFTGLMPNPPQVWIEPRTSDIDEEGTPTPYVDAVTVKLGVVGPSPDSITAAVLQYFVVMDFALRNASATQILDPTIERIFIQRHDYGPLFQVGNAFGRFPEMHLRVDRQEVMP